MAHAAGTAIGRGIHQRQGRIPGGWKPALAIAGLVAVTAIAIIAISTTGKQEEPSVGPGAAIQASPPNQGGEITTPGDLDQPAASVAEQPTTADVSPRQASEAAASNLTPASIRGTDFQNLPFLQTLIQQSGGRIDPAAVVYADLTGDGNEEAVVPVSSGGTYGNLAYVVLAAEAGGPRVLLTLLPDKNSLRGPAVSIENGHVVELVGLYGPEDPGCCPTQVKKTYLSWNGSAFAIEHEDILELFKPAK